MEPVDFEAETGNTPRLDSNFATEEPDGLANVGDVPLSGGLAEQGSIALTSPGPFGGVEEFFLGSLIPEDEIPEDEPADPGGSLGRIADAAGTAVAGLFEGPLGISRENLGPLVNQSPEDARTPVFGLIRTFNGVLIRGGSQAGDLALRAMAAPVVGGIEAVVQTAQELGMARTGARKLRRDLYMGAEVSAVGLGNVPAVSLRAPLGRLQRVAPTTKPGSLIDRMAETGALDEALQKVPPGRRQGVLKELQRGFDEGQRTARRELDRRGLSGGAQSEPGLTNRIGSLVEDSLKSRNRTVSLDLKQIDSAEAIRLKLDTGLDLTGYRHVIDSSAVRHTLNKHGNPRTEIKRGQIAVTESDFSRIPEILTSPDRVIYDGTNRIGRDVIIYEKRFNGVTYYVEEVRTGRKVTALQTMYKRPTK